MVLKRKIRIFFRVIFFQLAAFLFSCEEMVIVDCTKCMSTEPYETHLEIALNNNLKGVEITIYKGKMEDGIIVTQYSTFAKYSYFQVSLNNTYTIEAVYRLNGKTFRSVNSIMPKVKFDEVSCTDPCYFVYNNKVSLRLKYSY